MLELVALQCGPGAVCVLSVVGGGPFEGDSFVGCVELEEEEAADVEVEEEGFFAGRFESVARVSY